MRVAVREREVVREHREEHGQRQVVVVDRALLAAHVRGRVGLAARLLRAHELPVRGDDHEEDVRDHDRPEHRADLQVRGARRESCVDAVRGGGDEREHAERERALAAPSRPCGTARRRRATPTTSRPIETRADRPAARRQVRHARVDQVRVRLQVVEDDEEREAGEPRPVGLPLVPVQRLRQLRAGDPELLDAVEAAAVDLPRLAADAALAVALFCRRQQVVVERDEVERRCRSRRSPRSTWNQRNDEVEPVGERTGLRAAAIGPPRSRRARRAPSRAPRPSGGRSARAAPSRISVFGRRLTKTTKRKPCRASYSAFRRASSASTSGRRRRPARRPSARRAFVAPIAGCASRTARFSSGGARGRASRARTSGSALVREQLDERAFGPRRAPRARPRSAAAVGRAPVGRDAGAGRGGRAVAELDLELDAAEERRRRVEDEPVRARLDVGEARGCGPSASVSAEATSSSAAVELDADAGRRPAARRVEDVGRDHAANLRAWTRWCRAISSSSARTRRPSRHDLLAADVEPVDPVRAPRGRARRPGSAAPASSSPSGAPARRRPPACRARASRCRRGRAPRRRRASRAASASRDGHRRRAAAAARDEQRLLDLEEQVAALVRRRAVDAEPDAARPRRRASRTGATPRAEAQVRRRAVRRRRRRLAAKRATSGVGEVDAMRAPDVAGEPAERRRGTRPGVQP